MINITQPVGKGEGHKQVSRQIHSDVKKRRSSFLVALLFATGDLQRYDHKRNYILNFKIFVILICMLTTNFSFAGGIAVTKGWFDDSYSIEGKSVSFNRVKREINTVPEAAKEFDGYYLNYFLSLLMIPGAGLVGSELGGSAGGGDSDNGALFGGLALLGAGIYFSIQAQNKVDNAINAYNSKMVLQKTNKTITYAITPFYSGIEIKF